MIDNQHIGVGLSRNLGGATAPGENVESEIDAMISRRNDRRVSEEGERPLEDAWAAAERREAARRREENLEGWRAWHGRRAVLYAALAEEHAAAVEGLAGGGGA